MYLAPPPYKQQEIRSIKVRCLLSGAVNALVLTVTQIASLLPVFAVSATAGWMLCNSFRLKRTTIWGPLTNPGTSVSVQLKYADVPGSSGGIASDPGTVGDTTISFDHPAYCSLTPAKDGYFDNWLQTNNGSNMVIFTGPAGSTVDFDFQFLIDDEGTTTTTRALIGATPGVIYHLIATFSGAQTLTVIAPLNAI